MIGSGLLSATTLLLGSPHALRPGNDLASRAARSNRIVTQERIRLTVGTPAFVRENAGALLAISNLWWASYLEKVNQLAPLIIQKVERDGARRTPVAK